MLADEQASRAEAILRAALADKGLRLSRTEIADDALFVDYEHILVYLDGERKAIDDVLLEGDISSREAMCALALRVVERLKQRRARSPRPLVPA